MTTSSQQQFVIPNAFPFLEIRETSNSILPYEEHFHSSFSFGLILDGSTCFSLRGKKYVAKTGDIVLIAPEQVHSCNPFNKNSRSYKMAYLDAAWFHNVLGRRFYQKEGLYITEPLIRDVELFAEARVLFDMACSNDFAIESALTTLLTKMQNKYRCFSFVRDVRWHTATLAETSEKIMTGNYSVSDLARKTGVCRESFSRFFHRATGLPPSKYFHCLRLEHGRRMLHEGYSIVEAAIASGYVDQSHFHKMFVRYCSVTLGCYRKNQSHPYKK